MLDSSDSNRNIVIACQVTKAPARTGSNILFVRSETQPSTTEETTNVNPDEIDIDEDDEEDEEDTKIEEQQVPKQVFGSLKQTEDDE